MSTRSGKRIHSSAIEEEINVKEILVPKRKTRSNKQKENCETIETASKKKHYVRYPSEEDSVCNNQLQASKPSKKQRSTLQEINGLVSEESDNDKKPARLTRRTKKIEDEMSNVENEIIIKKTKKKKNNKKDSTSNTDDTDNVKTKVSKKKKKKKSTSIIVEDQSNIVPLNQSNVSVDSFHSAAGSACASPTANQNDLNSSNHSSGTKIKISKNSESKDRNESDNESNNTEDIVKNNNCVIETTNEHVTMSSVEKKLKKKKSRKRTFSIEKNDTSEETINKKAKSDKESVGSCGKINKMKSMETEDIVPDNEEKSNLNTTFEKEEISSNIAFEKILNASATNEKDKSGSVEKVTKKTKKCKDSGAEKNKESALNSTFEKVGLETSSSLNNSTSDKNLNSKTKKMNTKSQKHASDSLNKGTIKRHDISQGIEEKNNTEMVLNSTYEKENKNINYIDENSFTIDRKTEKIHNSTYDKDSEANGTKERQSLIILNKSTELNIAEKTNGLRKTLRSTSDTKSKDTIEENVLNATFDKEINSKLDRTFEKDEKQSPRLNSTFDKTNSVTKLDCTFDKPDNNSGKSSLLSSDRSDVTDDKSNQSRISITSDDSKENIINTTPVLIESSMDESVIIKDVSLDHEKTPSKLSSSMSKNKSPITPLKREGTFTKESNSPIAKNLNKTPSKRSSVASPGRTPFPASKSSSKKQNMLNVTRSIEKSRKSSLVDLPRATKVMFCSPVNNPVIIQQMKGKVIKSNLKGSNKSFIFNESVSDVVTSSRKRSYTLSDADDVTVKRKRLAEDLQQSVDRLSRPRTTSASAKLQDPTTPSKQTPQKSKDSKVTRTKLPNFAALHQKQFSKMESLDECQERKAKRARQMLATSSGLAEKTSPKEKDLKTKEAKKTATPVKSRLPTLDSLNPGYTRFGFKMNSDVNPFSNNNTKSDMNSSKIQFNSTKNDLNSTKTELNSTKTDLDSSKPDLNLTKSNVFRISTKSSVGTNLRNGTKTAIKPKDDKLNGLKRQTTLPSLTGSTVRKEMAKQTVMREKSFTEKRNINRNENRTIIKGVRTNRRFELQMKSRNIN